MARRDSLRGAAACPKLKAERKSPAKAQTAAFDPGCVKTTSQIGIVSRIPETIDAKVH